MDGPADLRMHSESPARLFSLAEANAILPRLNEFLARLDPKLARLREIRDLVEDTEAYWGGDLAAAPETDRERYAGTLQEQADLDRSVQASIDEIRSFGCELKDLQRGLVDFPALVADEVVYLCWQRGERKVSWWHTREAGFAGRRPLETETER